MWWRTQRLELKNKPKHGGEHPCIHKSWWFALRKGEFKILSYIDSYLFLNNSWWHHCFLFIFPVSALKVSSNIWKEDTVVEPGFHGRQITCVKCIETFVDPDSNQTVSVIATGSEDTKLIVSLYFHDWKRETLAGNVCIIVAIVYNIETLISLRATKCPF